LSVGSTQLYGISQLPSPTTSYTQLPSPATTYIGPYQSSGPSVGPFQSSGTYQSSDPSTWLRDKKIDRDQKIDKDQLRGQRIYKVEYKQLLMKVA